MDKCEQRGRLAQLVRAPALQAGGRRFEPCTAHHPFAASLSGDVVQLVRTLPCHGRGREFESRRPRHSFSRTYRKCSIFARAQKGTKQVQKIEPVQAELTFPAFFLGTRARPLPPAHFAFPLSLPACMCRESHVLSNGAAALAWSSAPVDRSSVE